MYRRDQVHRRLGGQALPHHHLHRPARLKPLAAWARTRGLRRRRRTTLARRLARRLAGRLAWHAPLAARAAEVAGAGPAAAEPGGPHPRWRRRGIARHFGRDVTVVRSILVLLALVSGFGAAGYVVAWLVLPPEGSIRGDRGAALVSDRRGLTLVLALVPVLVLLLVVLSVLRVSFLTSFVPPLMISAAGLVLIYRNAEDDERAWLSGVPAACSRSTPGRNAPGRPSSCAWPEACRCSDWACSFSTDALAPLDATAARGALLVMAATAVIFGPWWLRLARDLVAEAPGAHPGRGASGHGRPVHDSVLQTLALIQRSAHQPQEVASWPAPKSVSSAPGCSRAALQGSFGAEGPANPGSRRGADQREVEAAHGVAVDAVTVGEAPLDDELRALLAAGREATVNAAKWSGAPSVSIYTEVETKRVAMFIRDRGTGFDTEAIAEDRRGIAESIRGRMQRHGGTAVIRSVSGDGTEVELSVPRRAGRP